MIALSPFTCNIDTFNPLMMIQWNANTQAAVLPVTIAAMNGHTWESDLPVCKDQRNR